MNRTALVAKIDVCKADVRDLNARLEEAIRNGDEGHRVNRINAALRYQKAELNRYAHQLAEIDSCTGEP